MNVNGELKVIDLAPIVISAQPFEELKSFEEKKHRSDIIMLPKGGFITQISIKVVETNPKKVRAEKIASLWNDYKDEAKTVINNFLPKAEEKKEEDDTKKKTGETNSDKPVGN